MSLKLADKYVKEGDYKSALEAIAKARELDPTNPYAIAYEERVRNLLNAQQQSNISQPRDLNNPSTVDPELEQISRLAMQQTRQTIGPNAGPDAQPPTRQRVGEERLKQEELRRAAIRSKVTTVLSRAQQYLERDDFGRALDEISRALLLDPGNTAAHALEQQVRAAHVQSSKRKEDERARQAKEEEQRHQEQLRNEREQIQHELKEQHRREEEARRLAQKQKVSQYLARTRDLFSEGRLNEAQNELAFVVVIDPLNAEAATLGHQIRAKLEKIKQAEIEARRRNEEEERKKQEAINTAVTKHIENAKELASLGSYSEALRVITRAYVLDPVNEGLQECENSIMAEQEQAIQRAEAQRLKEEEERRKKENERRKKEDAAERERLIHGTTAENEAKRRENQERLLHHLNRAKDHVARQQFEGALSEVALAFLIDPFNDEVKHMEQQVLTAQSQNAKPNLDESSEITQDDEPTVDSSALIEAHVQEANKLRGQKRYTEALDELAKAFVLDPLNQSIQQCEETIQKEFVQFQVQEAPAAKQDPAPAASSHLDAAKQLIAKQSYDEALSEIALGLAANPDDSQLKELEQSIWQLQKKETDAKEGNPETIRSEEESKKVERLIRIHMLTAEEFVKHNDFAKALDELAKAFVIDPLNAELRKLEHRLRQQQIRHQQGEPQPLKLVYRGDKAAEG